MALGEADQDLATAVVEARVQGMGDRLGLHRGVAADPLEALLLDRLGLRRRGDRRLQQELDAVPPDPLPPTNQRARVDWQLELQVVEAAEVLPIGVLDPAFDHLLVGEAEGVLQVAQPDHQPDRDAGPAQVRMIELTEPRLEPLPVDQPGQPHQRMAPVDLLTEARAPEVIGGCGVELGRLHRNCLISTSGGYNPAIYNIW